ncbi:hypothetical protein FE88_12565 [Azospirillum brasilense]|nr:hypothetical protein FE89_30120 [Azospirillum brasilense]OPH20685.1 hypothetical protein FE88_12565 [Azospirillum brasilense]PWC87625.1 hypothetical protein AEJ54_25445 [Azospirillum sp. Sp 7]
MKTAALYARVSSDKQEKEQTIASQLETLHRAAAERGFQVAPDLVFADDGYSGARLDRPALDRLRDLAAEGGVAAVLIAAPDRLARHYAYQVLLLEELARAGCETIFLNHAFDGSPEHRMLLQMLGAFAEFERAMIRERTRAGLEAAKNQGRRGGRRPKLTTAQCREIIEMVTSGRKSAAEVSRLFGVHPATVSRLLSRARRLAYDFEQILR